MGSTSRLKVTEVGALEAATAAKATNEPARDTRNSLTLSALLGELALRGHHSGGLRRTQGLVRARVVRCGADPSDSERKQRKMRNKANLTRQARCKLP